jgi:type IV secretion system protein VirB6
VTTVDTIWSQGGAVADQLWHSGGLFQDIGYKLAGAAVWVLVGLLCVYTMFLIALSSIALAVLLALGPLFLTLLLFDATRRYFEAWLAQLANYALITILTVLVAALLLHIVQSYADQTAALGTAVKTVDALNMVLIAALVFLFMRQVMPVAAALGGGVALNTGGAVSRMVGWGVGSGAGLIRRGRELGLATLKVTSGASAAAEESAAGSASGRAAATRSQQAAWRES